jgi:hypothetical protein
MGRGVTIARADKRTGPEHGSSGGDTEKREDV